MSKYQLFGRADEGTMERISWLRHKTKLSIGEIVALAVKEWIERQEAVYGTDPSARPIEPVPEPKVEPTPEPQQAAPAKQKKAEPTTEQETEEILADGGLVEALARSEEDIAAGRVVQWDQMSETLEPTLHPYGKKMQTAKKRDRVEEEVGEYVGIGG